MVANKPQRLLGSFGSFREASRWLQRAHRGKSALPPTTNQAALPADHNAKPPWHSLCRFHSPRWW